MAEKIITTEIFHFQQALTLTRCDLTRSGMIYTVFLLTIPAVYGDNMHDRYVSHLKGGSGVYLFFRRRKWCMFVTLYQPIQ